MALYDYAASYAREIKAVNGKLEFLTQAEAAEFNDLMDKSKALYATVSGNAAGGDGRSETGRNHGRAGRRIRGNGFEP